MPSQGMMHKNEATRVPLFRPPRPISESGQMVTPPEMGHMNHGFVPSGQRTWPPAMPSNVRSPLSGANAKPARPGTRICQFSEYSGVRQSLPILPVVSCPSIPENGSFAPAPQFAPLVHSPVIGSVERYSLEMSTMGNLPMPQIPEYPPAPRQEPRSFLAEALEPDVFDPAHLPVGKFDGVYIMTGRGLRGMIRGVMMEMEMPQKNGGNRTVMYKLTIEMIDGQPFLVAQTFKGRTKYIMESCRIVGNCTTLFWRDIRLTKNRRQYVWTSIAAVSGMAGFQLAQAEEPSEEVPNDKTKLRISIMGASEGSEPGASPKPFFCTPSNDDEESEKGGTPPCSPRPFLYSDISPQTTPRSVHSVTDSAPSLETDAFSTMTYEKGFENLNKEFSEEKPKEIAVWEARHDRDYTSILPPTLASGRPLDWKKLEGKHAGWSVCSGELKEGEVITDEW